MSLIWEDVARLRQRAVRREVSAVEIASAFLERQEVTEGKIRAFLYRPPAEEILTQARSLDERMARGEEPGLLWGIPVAIKDNMAVEGMPMTAASRILEGYHPPYDATVVKKLREAGALVAGKTNLDEWAMGSSTETSAFGPTYNPWDRSRVPGGSSGGAAAAVAAGEVPLSLGSDTGGSIRQPASFCGVAGLKPTYGHISRYGVASLASSLDHIGPLARRVADAALLYLVLRGRDPLDGQTWEAPGTPLEMPQPLDSLKGWRIGLPKEAFTHPALDAQVKEAVLAAVELLAARGAQVEECSLPTFHLSLEAYQVLMAMEAASNLARFDGIRYGRRATGESLQELYAKTRGQGFGFEVKRRILLGTYLGQAPQYPLLWERADKVRRLLRAEMEDLFRRFHVLITPTSPTVAFPFGALERDGDLRSYADIYTIPANLTGVPALSVPCGFAPHLPVGMQLLGPWGTEESLFRVARTYEEEAQWPLKPPLGEGTGVAGRRQP
ncbi:MAG: Asp-tRNA(Asn)/Glu-tRNA(Gln) amidotransferase subunit GatA [Bacillota bacterium]|nr:Asp-tRNA(Asn)/Glu-tRNA(Gln) amidotransferase subunit GatA [Bacillota bacterium]